jgi:hypothetical protein
MEPQRKIMAGRADGQIGAPDRPQARLTDPKIRLNTARRFLTQPGSIVDHQAPTKCRNIPFSVVTGLRCPDSSREPHKEWEIIGRPN